MKNKIIYMLVAGSIMILASCKKNNLVVDKDVTPPAFAKFNASTLSGTYYIRATNDPFVIPIGITAAADKDRTINITYSSPSGAASGVQYNAPASIVIPAGEVLSSLTITGIYNGYPVSSKVDTLTVTIADGDIKANDYNKVYTLRMRKYCTVVLPALEGDYDNTNEYSSAGAFSYGPYTTSVSGLTSTGPTSAKGYISNIYDNGWSDIQVNIDWADPSAFKVTIPLQPTGTGGGDAFVRSSAGKTNTFSSCDQTFSLSIDLLNSSNAVTSSGYQIRLKR